MALSEQEIEATKVPYGRNQFKISDGGGLYLLVKSSGRYWKLAYRFDGKQKALALGVYPAVNLDQAREKRDVAKALLTQNIDPSEIRKLQRIEQRDAIIAQSASLQEKEAESRTSMMQRPAVLNQVEQQMLEERRLSILHVLTNCHGYMTNEGVLLQELDLKGYRISFDRLRTDIAWLYEQHAVTLKTGPLWGIYLTQYGLDTAHGNIWIPGIKRPQLDSQLESAED